MPKSTHTNHTEEKAVPHLFHAAFDKTEAARKALATTELITINLDVPIALMTVLGTLPKLTALRDDIVATLNNFDIAQFDKLSTYAEALAFAQSGYLAASQPEEALPKLVARATEIREQLLSDATALAKRGLLDGKRLAEMKGGRGYVNINSDLGMLVRMLRERWSDIASKSAIQPAELDEAEQTFERITFAYSGRTHQSENVAAATDDRQRAYTLLVNAYDQARRAAIYLRWSEGDADKIVPSLWAGRGGRGASSNTAPTPPVPADAKTAAADASGGPAPAAAAPVADAVPVGHPGGSPFASN